MKRTITSATTCPGQYAAPLATVEEITVELGYSASLPEDMPGEDL